MKSLSELYKIGRGPSSSHTMGPEKAAAIFGEKNPNADRFKVILYGSLAKTGKGHGTDNVLLKTFKRPLTVVFDETTACPHPNTFDLFAYDEKGEVTDYMRVFSIGGGDIRIDGQQVAETEDVYPHNSFEAIKNYCEQNKLTIPEYVEKYEGEWLRLYLAKVWQAMQNAIDGGLHANGKLPGGLLTERKAGILYRMKKDNLDPKTYHDRLLCAYAYAVAEQNAAGEIIVTAPTCGASGILPAVLRFEAEFRSLGEDEVIDALMTAGIIGNIIKTNASISGAECGCQAECGSACSMAAAAVAQIRGMSLDEIEYAAEVAMEHHLGLTCDPVDGLVQIPCIERNAVCAMRALDAVSLAGFLTNSRQISFDAVVRTMYQTGKDISDMYRETAGGGLAKNYSYSRLSSRFSPSDYT